MPCPPAPIQSAVSTPPAPIHSALSTSPLTVPYQPPFMCPVHTPATSPLMVGGTQHLLVELCQKRLLLPLCSARSQTQVLLPGQGGACTTGTRACTTVGSIQEQGHALQLYRSIHIMHTRACLGWVAQPSQATMHVGRAGRHPCHHACWVGCPALPGHHACWEGWATPRLSYMLGQAGQHPGHMCTMTGAITRG